MKYFTLKELTCTSTGLPNKAPKVVIERLVALVTNLLDPLREKYGKPIRVSSGYRSPAVNKAVGGVKNSQHLLGEAADLQCDNNKALFELIKAEFDFDQLIWEHGGKWVHVSYREGRNREQVISNYWK